MLRFGVGEYELMVEEKSGRIREMLRPQTVPKGVSDGARGRWLRGVGDRSKRRVVPLFLHPHPVSVLKALSFGVGHPGVLAVNVHDGGENPVPLPPNVLDLDAVEGGGVGSFHFSKRASRSRTAVAKVLRRN